MLGQLKAEVILVSVPGDTSLVSQMKNELQRGQPGWLAEGNICFGLAHQDCRCLRCWIYMETDGELGSRAQVRDLSTGLQGSQCTRTGPQALVKAHLGATNFQPLLLGLGNLSTSGHLGCGSCDRSWGSPYPRSLDSMLLSPLSIPVDFVSPLRV